MSLAGRKVPGVQGEEILAGQDMCISDRRFVAQIYFRSGRRFQISPEV